MVVIAQTAPALSARRTQAPLRSKRSPAARPARSLQQIRAQKIDNDYFSDSRRAVLLSGTALAANLCMPEFWMPPANAKKIISGSNPAAPGVTCAFLSHGKCYVPHTDRRDRIEYSPQSPIALPSSPQVPPTLTRGTRSTKAP